jgi:hydrogenase/urease accessory protein HupE
MSPRAIALIAVVIAAVFSIAAQADVFRPAYLEVRQQDAETYDVLWKVPEGGGTSAQLRVRLPDGVQVVQPPRIDLVGSVSVERSRVRRAGGLDGQTISIEGLADAGMEVLVRVVRLDGSEQVSQLPPSGTSFVVGSAGGRQVAPTYFQLGVQHILAGFDHLSFVLALLLVVRGVRRVVLTVTAFTIAHSITLAAATLGFVNLPSAPVEAMIALSIVFVAAEIVHVMQGRSALTARWPWLVAFAFGLLHGLGFAGALSEVGVPHDAVPLALLFFNLGVEAGQLLFVGAMAGVGLLLRRIRMPGWIEYIPAYGIGSLAMFWLFERTAAF